MNLKLAGADFTFPLLGHDKVLKLLSLLDLDGVDIGLFEKRSHLQPSEMFGNLEKNSRILHERIDDAGLEVADIFLQCDADFYPMASNHPNGKVREKARRWFLDTLEMCKICGSGHTTGLPGVYFEEEPVEKSYGRCCEELAWRVEKASEMGIVFSIEPHIGSIVPDPVSAEKLVKDVPGLTLTLDYTHFRRIGMPDKDIEPLVKHATHFHVRGAAKGRLQTSFKKNEIDYRRILEVMKNVGYSGYLGVEYIWIDWENCNEVDNVAEVIQFRDYLRAEMNKIQNI